jgi:hypothetical protein
MKKEVKKLRRYFDNTILNKSASNKKLMEAWEGSNPKPPLVVRWVDWLEGAITGMTTCASSLAKAKKK